VPYLLGLTLIIAAGLWSETSLCLHTQSKISCSFFCTEHDLEEIPRSRVVAAFSIAGIIGPRVGIFDIDDCVLKRARVVHRLLPFAILANWIRSQTLKKMVVASLVGVRRLWACMVESFIDAHQPVNPVVDRPNARLCGGTGGTGQIVSVDDRVMTIKRKTVWSNSS